jgi:hypothetical protein
VGKESTCFFVSTCYILGEVYMKKFMIGMALAISVAACSSCSETPAPTTPDASVSSSSAPEPVPSIPPPPPQPTTVKVEQEGWECTLPDATWVQMDTSSEGLPDGVASVMVFRSDEHKNVVVLTVERFAGSLGEYTLAAVRGVKEAEAVVNSVSPDSLNGHDFTLLESSRSNIRMWMWVAVEHGQGYGFSCGGPDSDEQRARCRQMASTLKFN